MPGMGKPSASASTSLRSAWMSGRALPSAAMYALNSLSLAGAGVLAAQSLAICGRACSRGCGVWRPRRTCALALPAQGFSPAARAGVLATQFLATLAACGRAGGGWRATGACPFTRHLNMGSHIFVKWGWQVCG